MWTNVKRKKSVRRRNKKKNREHRNIAPLSLQLRSYNKLSRNWQFSWQIEENSYDSFNAVCVKLYEQPFTLWICLFDRFGEMHTYRIVTRRALRQRNAFFYHAFEGKKLSVKNSRQIAGTDAKEWTCVSYIQTDTDKVEKGIDAAQNET